jgi:hypothetical protein
MERVAHRVIPFDVLDRIVGCLQADARHAGLAQDPRDLSTLRALRLTSRAFLYRSTSPLFCLASFSTHEEDWERLRRIANTPSLAGCVSRLRYREWHCGRVRDEEAYVAGFQNRYPSLFAPDAANGPVSIDSLRRGYQLHKTRSQLQRDLVFSEASELENIEDIKRLVEYLKKFNRLRCISITSQPVLSPWLGPGVRYLKQGQWNIAAVHSPGDKDHEAIECFARLVGRAGSDILAGHDNLIYSWLILRMLKLVLGVVSTRALESQNISVEADLFGVPFRIRDLNDILLDSKLGETTLRRLDLNVKIECNLDLTSLHVGVVECWLKQFPNLLQLKLQPTMGILEDAPLNVLFSRAPLFGSPDFRCLRHLTIWSAVVSSAENLMSLLTITAKTLKTLEIDHLAYYEKGELNRLGNPDGNDPEPDSESDIEVDEIESDYSSGEPYPESRQNTESESDDETFVPGLYRGWSYCGALLHGMASLNLDLHSFTVFPDSYFRYLVGGVRAPKDALGYMITNKADIAKFLKSDGIMEGRRESIIMINERRVRVYHPQRFPEFMLD